MDMDALATTTASTATVHEPARWPARAIKAALVASLASVPLTLTTPASAAMDQISGVGVFDTENQCNDAVESDFSDWTMVLTGDLDGCWYTNVETARTTPSGVYLETGEEIFVGSLNGGPVGTFTTTYKIRGQVRSRRLRDPRALPASHRGRQRHRRLRRCQRPAQLQRHRRER